MLQLFESIVDCSGVLIPFLALWAIASLYTARSESESHSTQAVFFGALLFIAVVTIRTVMVDEGCWLLHTSSLGAMIVAGVLRRPATEDDDSGELLFN